MAKVISQSTFDDVVKENMTEFDMDVDDAIEDATKQFEAQGISLDNIVKDLVKYSSAPKKSEGETATANGTSSLNSPELKHPLLLSVAQIQELLSNNGAPQNQQSSDSFLPHLKSLREQCGKDAAHRGLAAKEGALPLLWQCLEVATKGPCMQLDLTTATLDALAALLNGQPDLVEGEPHLRQLVHLVEQWNSTKVIAPMARALVVLRVACTLHEGHRQFLVNQAGVVPLLMATIEAWRGERSIVKEACGVLRVLTVDDDIRVEFGHGHEHAKSIVMETNALGTLLHICQDFTQASDHAVVSEIFHTLSALSVRNEFCQQVLDQGGVEFLVRALDNHCKHADIASSASALLKTLCGNDNVKLAVVQCGGIQVVLRALQMHLAQEPVAYNACCALGAACLRNPEAAQVAVGEAGAAHVLMQVMERYKTKADVFRAACLAVRNIVSRSPDLREPFLLAGMEAILNKPGLKLCGDEAKAALRDLDCQVHFVERWTGQRGQIPQG